MDERDRFLRAVALESRVDVCPSSRPELGGVEYARLYPFLIEDPLEKERRLQLVARRVRRVHADIVRKNLHRLVRQRIPVDRSGSLSGNRRPAGRAGWP